MDPMDHMTNLASIPVDAGSYDEFLGRFIDALQASSQAFPALRESWVSACPPDWGDRFRADLDDIATLVDAGVLGIVAA